MSITQNEPNSENFFEIVACFLRYCWISIFDILINTMLKNDVHFYIFQYTGVFLVLSERRIQIFCRNYILLILSHWTCV